MNCSFSSHKSTELLSKIHSTTPTEYLQAGNCLKKFCPSFPHLQDGWQRWEIEIFFLECNTQSGLDFTELSWLKKAHSVWQVVNQLWLLSLVCECLWRIFYSLSCRDLSLTFSAIGYFFASLLVLHREYKIAFTKKCTHLKIALVGSIKFAFL